MRKVYSALGFRNYVDAASGIVTLAVLTFTLVCLGIMTVKALW